MGIMDTFGLRVKISKKDSINISNLNFSYHRIANRKNRILLQEKYFRNLKDMLIGTASTFFELCTIFQSGGSNSMGVKYE